MRIDWPSERAADGSFFDPNSTMITTAAIRIFHGLSNRSPIMFVLLSGQSPYGRGLRQISAWRPHGEVPWARRACTSAGEHGSVGPREAGGLFAGNSRLISLRLGLDFGAARRSAETVRRACAG